MTLRYWARRGALRGLSGPRARTATACRWRAVLLAGLALMACMGLAPAALAQRSSDSPATMSADRSVTAEPPRGDDRDTQSKDEESQPWYRWWRLNIGLFIQYHSLEVTQRGSGEHGTILSQHTYGLVPFGSTPEWTFYKRGGQTLGGAIFFGAGFFTVNEQKIKRPDANQTESASCDTCDAKDYKDLGTSVRGSYQFITPAVVYTIGSGKDRGAFRMAAGVGVTRGDASGDIYINGRGTVAVDGGGHVTGSAHRVRFSESSSDYSSPSYLILIEFVFPSGVGISAASDFMHINGKSYRLSLEEFRGGVTYEFRF